MNSVVTEDSLACDAFRGLFVDNCLSGLTWHDAPVEGTLLSVDTLRGPLPGASDAYTRGGDRVTTHAPSEAFPFQTQLLWSAAKVAGGVAVTLTVSLQTDLLDSQPNLALVTQLPGVSPRRRGPDALRFDLPKCATLLLTPHPSDTPECAAVLEGERGVLKLSPPFLEKGVIRRCRVAAIWLPADSDDAAIEAALADFADQPLPLTT
ncbi:hypothetical protein MalM25_03160 [Planctomycetes bacterium MalM25]|nr:hypothetical protein MalM25_03160 [Planctomycetes bacterium MalM25]